MNWRPWACPVVSLVVAGALLAMFGVSPLTIVGTAILLACPVAAVWAYIAGERELGALDQLRKSLAKRGEDGTRFGR